MDAARHITGGSILLFQEVIQDSLCGLVITVSMFIFLICSIRSRSAAVTFMLLIFSLRHCKDATNFRINQTNNTNIRIDPKDLTFSLWQRPASSWIPAVLLLCIIKKSLSYEFHFAARGVAIVHPRYTPDGLLSVSIAKGFGFLVYNVSSSIRRCAHPLPASPTSSAVRGRS